MLDVRCSYTIISTSPSLYLQVLGTAAASDMCTSVGPVLTGPIITLAPGELSTWATLTTPQEIVEDYTSQYGPGATWVMTTGWISNFWARWSHSTSRTWPVQPGA